MKKAVFPGSFDPFHNGHLDIVLRASKLTEELVVAVYDKPKKNCLFSLDERLELSRLILRDVRNVSVVGYSGLTVEFCHKIGAQVMFRGLRVFSDFEFEFRMALANHRLKPNVEVIALITSEENTFLSSTTVREIAQLGGDVSSMVPAIVKDALDKKFKID